MPVIYAATTTASTLARVMLTVVAPSGTPALEFLRFTFSDDAGTTWTPVRFAERVAAAPGQTITVYDYEAPPNTQRRYGVQSIRVTTAGEDVISARGTQDPSGATVAVTVAPDSWWLKDPLDPSANMRVQIYRRGDELPGPTTTERREDFQPIGRKYDSTVSDVIEGMRWELTFTLYGDAELDAFETLRDRKRTLLLQSMHDRGKRAQYYVRLGKELRLSKLVTQGFETNPVYRVTMELSERARP